MLGFSNSIMQETRMVNDRRYRTEHQDKNK